MEEYWSDGTERAIGEEGDGRKVLKLYEGRCGECDTLVYKEIGAPDVKANGRSGKGKTKKKHEFMWPNEFECVREPCIYVPHVTKLEEDISWEHNENWADTNFILGDGAVDGSGPASMIVGDEAEETIEREQGHEDAGEDGYDSDASDSTARPCSLIQMDASGRSTLSDMDDAGWLKKQIERL
jgi:hypothetical protein